MSVHNRDAFSGRKADTVCVHLASDAECDNFVLQGDIQAFMRAVAIPRRRVLDWLYDAARRARTVLVDSADNQVRLADLSEENFISFDLWLRDYIAVRPPHIKQRNRPESLERRRALITLLRMAFPSEATTWGRPLTELGVQFTHHRPLEDG